MDVSLILIFEIFKLIKLKKDVKLLFFKLFKSFLQKSKCPAFNVRTKKGYWRQLTLRTNSQKEILAIVVFDKNDLSEVIIYLKLL